MSNKKQDIYRGHKEKGMWWLDEFEHIYTCWANHRNKHLKSVMLNVECVRVKKTRFNKN